MHGYYICSLCKAKLGLFTDETIQKYINQHKKDKSKPSFKKKWKED